MKPIQFYNAELLFAYPAPKNALTPNGIGWKTRDDSFQILARTAPSSWFNPLGFTSNTSHRHVAVEIEISNYINANSLNKTIRDWNCSVVHDGSVRSDKGFEINTAPACGDVLLEELKAVTDGLMDSTAKINEWCSIHTHVDCRDFGYQDIQKLIKVYAHIEEALFASVHWSRYKNAYCMPCGQDYYNLVCNKIKPDTKNLKNALVSSVYGSEPFKRFGIEQTTKFHKSRQDHYGRTSNLGERNPKRYSALNIHSYFLRGTIENRIHHGSTNFEEISQWAKFQVDFFDVIYKTSDAKLRKMLEVSTQETEEILELINASKIIRTLDLMQVAVGLVILRTLLPEHFDSLIKKINLACHDKYISNLIGNKVFPCQLKELVVNSSLKKKKEVVEQIHRNPAEQGR